MSYLLRVLLPDTPGSLGKLANALGAIDGNIQSVDVIQANPDGTAMDDIVVDLPTSVLPDSLITAAVGVPGVAVDSIRPFSGSVDRRGQIKLLASLTGCSEQKAMEELVNLLPRTMTSGWAIALRVGAEATRIAASPAAPEDNGHNPAIKIEAARKLDPETEAWIPSSWALLDAALAAAPIGDSDVVIIAGRPGGPDFLASEVEHLGDLATIVGAMMKRPRG